MRLFLVLLCFVLIFKNAKFYKIVKKSPKETSIEYFTKQTQNITIPIMIHIDSVLTKMLAKQYKTKRRHNMRNISKNLLKDVEKLFKHSNLNQEIKFKLIDTKFLRNNMKKFTMDENVSKYLESYCSWQGEVKMMKKKWYYSVLLTGIDVYYIYNKRIIRSSTGRSYMRSVCSIFNSCTLLEWKPKNLSYLLAHEIGHSLGITHDGQDYNDCRSTKHIMTPKYNPHNHPQTWSTCSRRDLDMFLVSKKSWCLRPDYELRLQAHISKYKSNLEY